MDSNTQSNVFSIRIVSVDHYMNKPIPELDSCYSEFRGSDIKKVPVIRLFGSTRNGDKLCAHIHNVYPYLYIAYDGGNDLNCDRYMYQIAASLDKAINLSLGNTQSSSQHVFKIALVKGIPYYGYHAGEHQFLKIFLYNPYFLKRAANLFQNGAILGKSYQTYETHLPYLLQFFIDYNLYGMSMLHVEKDAIVIRNDDSENGVPKMSVSEIEIDISSTSILNRLTLHRSKTAEHANPGISNIWNDERSRREILQLSEVEIPLTPAPLDVVTESDLFYREALQNKLKLLREDEESKFAAMDTKDTAKVRNRAVLYTDVYPGECPNDSPIMEASIIIDHKGKTGNSTTMLENDFLNNSGLDDTIVDEDIIMSLSQKPNYLDETLRDEDRELLEIMKRLEENSDDVENDSILAQLTQTKSDNLILSQLSSNADLNKSQILEKTLVNEDDMDNPEDDDAMDDFSFLLNDDFCLNSASKDVIRIDQLDGAADDDGDHKDATPKKRKIDVPPSRRSKRLQNKTDVSLNETDFSHSSWASLFKCVVPLTNIFPRNSLENDPYRISKEYDRKNNFYPIAGPSNYDFLKSIADVDVPPIGCAEENSLSEEPILPTIVKKKSNAQKRSLEKIETEVKSTNGYPIDPPNSSSNNDVILIEDDDDDDDDNPAIQSFYNKSSAFDDSKLVVTSAEEDDNDDDVIITNSISHPKGKVVTLKELPPSFEDYDAIIKEYSIPKVVNTEPFYGDANDVSGKKEVGHTVLNIPGNSLNNCEEFKSIFSDNGLLEWRKKKVSDIFDCKTDDLSIARLNSNEIRELLSRETTCVISSSDIPPTMHEAKVWMKARNAVSATTNGKIGEGHLHEDDSPIKVRREKIRMGVSTNGDAMNGDAIEIVNGDSDDDCVEIISASPPLTPFRSIHDRVAASHSKVPSSQSGSQTPSSSHMRVRKSLLSKFKDYSRKRRHGKRKSPNLFGDSSPSTASHNSEDIFSSLKSSQNSITSECSNNTIDSSVSESSIQKLIDKSSFVAQLNANGNQSLNISFGITGHSHDNPNGFKVQLENLQDAKALNEYNFLTLLTCEIHVQCRGDLKPDPDIDPMSAIFYTIMNDVPDNHKLPLNVCGVIMTKQNNISYKIFRNMYGNRFKIDIVDNEFELFDEFLKLVRLWDPDIFTGYEIEMSSWGYLIERGNVLGKNCVELFSRTPDVKNVQFVKDDDAEGDAGDITPQLKIIGRILLDIWRLLRHEIALTSYTFENIMYHILHKRCPLHSHKHLTQMWTRTSTIWIVLDYYFERVNGCIEILKQLDLIGRTCELAKLFGIQFYEVLSRGSQYRVESMMLRIAKPRNFISVSPNQQQKVNMRAPEYLPLILEPQSRFYGDPLIVLDFQSLYPSIIIGYNMCFSTCLGRVEYLGDKNPFEFGASQLKVDPQRLQKLMDANLITISPCGVVFVKKSVREGILPRMLREILDTRIMVKQSMKVHKTNNILQRVLHARQLGLKLMANVTYGYTAANFSGRMPCVDIADSVVSKSRETLERAIKLVEANDQWQAKVVYGDTDSLFVLLPGRTREDAFVIGEEIAAAVTKENPPPMKLKMEKVYFPCILQTKKRYVGFMYENPDQKDPVYEAKGIETVRRDGCPAVAKILEKTLRILFQTRDVSEVKRYISRQFTKIMSGKANIQDFIFAKEFRGLNGYKPTACVPALELTKKWKLTDKRNEPRRGERVPFVIVNGQPGLPLIRLVRSPHDLLADDGLKINATYYITKAIIPPLNRCLLLIGADVHQWFADMPRKVAATTSVSNNIVNWSVNRAKKSTISQYFATTNCAADCGEQTQKGICNKCRLNPQKTVATISRKIWKLDRRKDLMQKICQSCCGRFNEVQCKSLDCPVLFVSNKVDREFNQIEYIRYLLEEM